MKTLIYKLRKHQIELEKKVEIYNKFFKREELKVIKNKENVFANYYISKYNALKKTDRYFKIYGGKI